MAEGLVSRMLLLMSSSLEQGSVDDAPDPPLLLPLLHPLLLPFTAGPSLPNDPDRVWNWKDANSRKSGTSADDDDADDDPVLELLLPLIPAIILLAAAAADVIVWLLLLLLL